MKQEEFTRSHTASVVSGKVRETSHLWSHVGTLVYIKVTMPKYSKDTILYGTQMMWALRSCETRQ
jgi:hypothetical protein